MIRFIQFIFFACVIAGYGQSVDDGRTSENITNRVFQGKYDAFEKHSYQKDGNILAYRLLYPEAMEAGAKYPLFVFLHGNGKRGTDNESQLDRGADLFLKPENRADFSCIALYPQAPESFMQITVNGVAAGGSFAAYTRLNADDKESAVFSLSPYGVMVHDVIQQLIARGIVDTGRIYISGSSMGGFSTYQFIADYPDLFAAAAPIASATTMDVVDRWIGKIPVWLFVGDQDSDRIEEVRGIVQRLEKSGAEYRYNEYPGVGHSSWNNAFAEPDYLAWFFLHSKTITIERK